MGGCVFEIELARPPSRPNPALLDLDLPQAGAPARRWSVRLDAGMSHGLASPPPSLLREWSLDVRARRIRFPACFPMRQAAPFLHEAMLAVLRLHGRVPLHAAAVTLRRSSDALLLVGASGHGKSSLAWNALARGGRVVSDDLVGLYQGVRGRLALCPLRRTVAVVEDILAEGPRPNGVWENQVGLRKLRFDPLALRADARVDPARPRRLAFLERGEKRLVNKLAPREAFERLLAHTPLLGEGAAFRLNLELLRRLAEETEAVAATLSRACLADEAILDELAA